jgi:hypothetical protein
LNTAGAVILDKAPASAKGYSNLLNNDEDEYAIAPCSEEKWVVVGLSEDIVVSEVVIAQYEKYSSKLREFNLSIAINYPSDHWKDLGTYQAKPILGEQSFLIGQQSAHSRYLKVHFLTHYDNDQLCTISQIKVHGTTVIASLTQELQVSNSLSNIRTQLSISDILQEGQQLEKQLDEEGAGQAALPFIDAFGTHQREDEKGETTKVDIVNMETNNIMNASLDIPPVSENASNVNISISVPENESAVDAPNKTSEPELSNTNNEAYITVSMTDNTSSLLEAVDDVSITEAVASDETLDESTVEIVREEISADTTKLTIADDDSHHFEGSSGINASELDLNTSSALTATPSAIDSAVINATSTTGNGSSAGITNILGNVVKNIASIIPPVKPISKVNADLTQNESSSEEAPTRTTLDHSSDQQDPSANSHLDKSNDTDPDSASHSAKNMESFDKVMSSERSISSENIADVGNSPETNITIPASADNNQTQINSPEANQTAKKVIDSVDLQAAGNESKLSESNDSSSIIKTSGPSMIVVNDSAALTNETPQTNLSASHNISSTMPTEAKARLTSNNLTQHISSSNITGNDSATAAATQSINATKPAAKPKYLKAQEVFNLSQCRDILKYEDFHTKILAKLQASSEGDATSGSQDNVIKQLLLRIRSMELNYAITEMYISQISDCYRGLISEITSLAVDEGWITIPREKSNLTASISELTNNSTIKSSKYRLLDLFAKEVSG